MSDPISQKNHVAALKAAAKVVKRYRAQLAAAPANQWPDNWDSVVVAEVLAEVAFDLHRYDRGADVPSLNRFGIAALPAFIGSYWPTVEMLTQSMPEPAANLLFFETAAKRINEELS